jgi:mannose-6-phosphate isomerase
VAGEAGTTELLPGPARPFFRAQSVIVSGTPVSFAAEFAILIVLDGEGTLETGAGPAAPPRGSTVLVPYGAGPSRLAGQLTVLRCLPPEPQPEGTQDRQNAVDS